VTDIPLSPRETSYADLAEIESGLPMLGQKPWLLLWGMQDWCFTPDFLERFIQLVPTAEVHRVWDAGHYVVEDAHARIVPLVADFLRRHAAAPTES
jgi:haloalkane dehalogenase